MNYEEEVIRLQKENAHLRECLLGVSGQFQDLKERFYRNVKKGGDYWTPEEQNSMNRFWEEAAKENFDINDLMDALQGLDTDDDEPLTKSE